MLRTPHQRHTPITVPSRRILPRLPPVSRASHQRYATITQPSRSRHAPRERVIHVRVEPGTKEDGVRSKGANGW